MFRKTEDFINNAKYEFSSTIKVFDSMTDESLHKKIEGYPRTPGFLAWHMTKSVTDILELAGLKNVYHVPDDMPAGLTVADLKNEFNKAADSALKEVNAYWKDENLTEETPMYGGENWKKGTTLFIVLTHLIHHRGQLGVLMRINGCKVPGIYGPAKEEWTVFGMPEMP